MYLMCYILGSRSLLTTFHVSQFGLLQYLRSSSRALGVSIIACCMYSSSDKMRGLGLFLGNNL